MSNKKFLNKEITTKFSSANRFFTDNPNSVHIVNSYYYIPTNDTWILCQLDNRKTNYSSWPRKVTSLDGISNNIIQQIKKVWLTLNEIEEYLKLKMS